MKKRSWAILALIVIFSVGAMAVFSEDFSGDGLPEGFKVIEGNWTVEDGRLIGESASGAIQGRVIFGPEMGDFIYSVDATMLSALNTSRWFSIFFRSNPTGMAPYHMFTIRQNATAGNGTELAFREPGGTWDVRRTKAYKTPFKYGETHRIKVAVKGDYFFYFIDDELQFAACEKGFRDSGVFGLHVNGCKVAFDNIKIEPYDSKLFAELEEQVAQEQLPVYPRIAAHRGNSSVAPENTIAAIKSALEVGADLIEIDVHKTKDGEIVVIHDPTVDRTTNGRGYVANMTLEEIRALDAGSKKSAIYKGEKIPTLKEALITVNNKAMLIIELKVDGIEEEVLRLIEDVGMVNQVVVISFSASAIRRMNQIAPHIPTAILIGGNASISDIERIAKSANTRVLDLAYTLIDKKTAAYFLDRGYTLWAWTVDNPAIMEHLKDCGVTVITTNVPAKAISTLRYSQTDK
ncbi:MAG TPA: DUF1080 domain-containing protein [Firmicutes bacterium]|nr:DUF1080 domain-containing protein [Bacillota bacterium]